MTVALKQLTDFFIQIGADQVGHTEKSYLAHAIGVHQDLRTWGCDEELCRAGLFHSIYGTQKFQKFALPTDRRDELREMIGERAERLAFVNCLMDRESFDRAISQTAGPYVLGNRVTGEPINLTDVEFDDLCRVHLCDWLEQVPRCREWDYRREAYQGLAERLGGVARASYNRVYAAETASSTDS